MKKLKMHEVTNKGNIFIFNNTSKKSIYSILQHFFTGYKYSHTSIGLGVVFDDLYTLSADMMCYVQPLYKYLTTDPIVMEVYKFKLSDSKINGILNDLVKEYSGKKYAFTQILWFVYRWFCEKFLKKDVRNSHNWFAINTVVCSELTYIYLERISEVYKLKDLRKTLNEWRSSNVHVGDIKNIVDLFPNYFEKVDIP